MISEDMYNYYWTMKLKKILGIAGIFLFVVVICVVSIIFVKNFGSIMENPKNLRDAIGSYGFISFLIYVLLYVFQILFAPIPGQVLNIASGMLFGIVQGFFVSWFSVIIGGFLAMLFARWFGKKILHWFLEEKALRFENEITQRGLPLILFLAIFPSPIGDGLFYLAGLTNIPLRILTLLIAVCRIPGILIYVIAGDRIMSAGVKGWIIGSLGFVVALVLYLVLRKRFELVFMEYVKRFNKRYY